MANVAIEKWETYVRMIGKRFFDRDADSVAKDLIGANFLVGGVGGVIVETESYDATDPASHSFEKRRTKVNAAMFGPPARAHVYFTYGLHWMMNFVCQEGEGVLVRALEPTTRVDLMRRRRGTDNLKLLCSGPARVTQALKITGKLDQMSVLHPPFALAPPSQTFDIVRGPRIGISKGVELVRRFGMRGSAYLSKKFAE